MELVAILLIAGVLLLLLETVLPGLIAGIGGLACLAAGIVLSYSRFGAEVGNWVLMGVLVLLMIGTVLWLKYFPTSSLARPFISTSTIGTVDAERPELLNLTGTASTALRPSGVALINGERIHVVAETGMIERGVPITVISTEGLRVVVRAIPLESQQPT